MLDMDRIFASMGQLNVTPPLSTISDVVVPAVLLQVCGVHCPRACDVSNGLYIQISGIPLFWQRPSWIRPCNPSHLAECHQIY